MNIGLAKRLYNEKSGRQLGLNEQKWPVLMRILEEDKIDYADFALTDVILREEGGSEETALLLCYLSKAARMGNLCVYLDEEKILPDPMEILEEDFSESIRKGLTLIPENLITNVELQDHPTTPLCRYNNFLYLQRHFLSESQFLHSYQRLLDESPAIPINPQIIEEKLREVPLNERQKEAVVQSCRHGFFVLCGGPGTGKTYTASQIIRIFQEVMPLETEIAIAAPTGKAAANLEKSLPLKAKTLHSLLGIRSGRSWRTAPERLTADLIVVDESSMIDVNLMARLLQSIKPGARLILLGDPYQLPPVEAGSLFSDIVKSLQTQEDCRVVELQECLRMELKEIVDFAETVKQGDVETALSYPINPLDKQRLFEQVVHRFSTKAEDPAVLWEHFQKFRILSPLRKGPFGVEAINKEIYRRLVPKTGSFAVPIMIVNNDYRLELFNGEVGILIRENPSEDSDDLRENDYALFPAGEGQPMRRFPALLLPRFEYAYCLSVHKSQGSEFDHVLMLLPESSEKFGRELLYTGITRARKQLEIWGDPVILQEIVRRHSRRLSGMIGSVAI